MSSSSPAPTPNATPRGCCAAAGCRGGGAALAAFAALNTSAPCRKNSTAAILRSCQLHQQPAAFLVEISDGLRLAIDHSKAASPQARHNLSLGYVTADLAHPQHACALRRTGSPHKSAVAVFVIYRSNPQATSYLEGVEAQAVLVVLWWRRKDRNRVRGSSRGTAPAAAAAAAPSGHHGTNAAPLPPPHFLQQLDACTVRSRQFRIWQPRLSSRRTYAQLVSRVVHFTDVAPPVASS